jgi:hypothetical protein
MWPWAAVYVAQISIGMLVWAVLYVGGIRGWATGLGAAVPLALLAWLLYRSRDRFRAPQVS